MTDGILTDQGTVTITVTPVNHPPVADNDSGTVLEDAAATTIPVLAGDTDPDGVAGSGLRPICTPVRSMESLPRGVGWAAAAVADC